MKRTRLKDNDDDDGDFLSQVAQAEAHALSHFKLRNITAVNHKENEKIIKFEEEEEEEGAYIAALRGRSRLKPSASSAPYHTPSYGGGGAVEFGGSEPSVPEKSCPCGLGICVIFTANTERNRGRKFYKCPVRQENGGCGFFEWCDINASGGTTQSYAGSSNSVYPHLPCPCGAGSCLLLT